jgi:hypothetical protein
MRSFSRCNRVTTGARASLYGAKLDGLDVSKVGGRTWIMRIDGGCHCGYITYEAEVDPEKTAVCHCGDCQTLSGSAFRTVVFTLKGTFKVLSGQLKIYVKTGESGTERPQAFWPECGTPIYSTTVEEEPKVHAVRVGTVRQRNELVPRVQLWFRSAQHWVPGLGSIPKIEKQPVFDRSGAMT